MPHAPLTVGRIRYINNYPLFGGFLSSALPPPCRWEEGSPQDLNRALREGHLDLSLVSTAEYLQGKDTLYTLVPPWCIAAKEKSLSVHLYHKKPLEHLDGQKVFVTSESATSTLLLKVLCHHHWGIRPLFFSSPAPEKEQDATAFLLIGDHALSCPSLPQHQTKDLASAWHAMTHLPFVFAVFAAHRHNIEKKEHALKAFQNAMAASFSWGQEHPKRLVAMALLDLQRWDCNEALVQKYYQTLSYELTEEMMQGLRLFDTLRQHTPP